MNLQVDLLKIMSDSLDPGRLQALNLHARVPFIEK